MESKSNLKYIARKGSNIDLENLKSKNKFRLIIEKVLRVIDKFLFQKPFRSFSFLIMIFAFPLSLYLTLRNELYILKIEAENSNLILSTGKIEDLDPNVYSEYSFKMEGYNIEDLEFIEVNSPSWFSRGNEVENEGEGGISKSYKYITYSGKADFDISDEFAILAKATKLTSYSECNGCDKDEGNLYALSEFILNTNSCDGSSVWGRNPVGSNNEKSGSANCQKFDSGCLVPSSWKRYDSEEDCINDNTSPIIKDFIDDKIFKFNIDCDGSITSPIPSFNETIIAKDDDGEVIRFKVNSEGDFVNLKQDSIETIVKQISSKGSDIYENFEYSASIDGKVSTDFIGKTSTVEVDVCDVRGNCINKDFDISAVKRGVCDFILPVTGEMIEVNISYPQENLEYSGIDNVVLNLNGSNIFDVKVDLYNENCTQQDDFISNIATYYKYRISEDDQEVGNKGLVVSFDSRVYEDDKYCIKVFARDASIDSSGSNWEDYASVKFYIRNDNQNPTIISILPDTNLVTGESFKYKIEANDPDGDKINYDVIGCPDWMTFESQTISGTTVVPGMYNLVVFVDDNHGGYDTQPITINVHEPENQVSQIEFKFPIENSVLSGENNIIRWEASDNEGISQIQLYYSSDGENWELIGTYPAGTNEANWDVSNIADGQYYVKIVITDNSAKSDETSLISKMFYISNHSEDDDTEDGEDDQGDGDISGVDDSMPSINNLAPVDGSEINSTNPLISASMHPSNDAEIDTESVKVELDDESILSVCEVTSTEIMCKVEEDLDLGRHKVKISVQDTNEKSVNEEWYFTIVEIQGEEEDSEEDQAEDTDDNYITIPILNVEMNRNALVISSILCGVALLLILIPWLIYFIWSRRSGGSDDDYSPVDTGSSDVPVAPINEPSDKSDFYTTTGYRDPAESSQYQQQEDYNSQTEVNTDSEEDSDKDLSMPHGYTKSPPDSSVY